MTRRRRPREIHLAPSPFPFYLTGGATVIDEACRCGHLRTDHFDVLGLAYGHAACSVSACPCETFTWITFVLMDAEPVAPADLFEVGGGLTTTHVRVCSHGHEYEDTHEGPCVMSCADEDVTPCPRHEYGQTT
jgi:hypothetical protein